MHPINSIILLCQEKLMIIYRPTIAAISLDAVKHNIQAIQKKVGAACQVMAVVKANAAMVASIICGMVFSVRKAISNSHCWAIAEN